jgi:hypothetical protein
MEPQLSKNQKRQCNEAIKSAIFSVLSDHWGIDNAISANELKSVLNFSSGGKSISSREIRNCISELRKDGNLICSLAGSSEMHGNVSGYFIPATFEEYKAYRNFYTSYAIDIFETIRAMDKEARATFIYDYQPPLFSDPLEESG